MVINQNKAFTDKAFLDKDKDYKDLAKALAGAESENV